MTKKDKDFRLLHIREMHDKTRVIPMHSIIRGSYIVSEEAGSKDSLIVDIVDSDMFLRIHAMYPL